MNSMSLSNYVQAVFRDRWVDGGVNVMMLLLIASWLVPRHAADVLIDLLATGVLLAVAVRIGYVIACVRMGRETPAESSRSVRIRETVRNLVGLSFFVIALLLIVLRYLR